MRPAFAKEYPEDPVLERLLEAFDRGDFGRVRRDAPKLVAGAASQEVRAAASDLLARTNPDPLSVVFFGLAALLLVFLSGFWWWRGGP